MNPFPSPAYNTSAADAYAPIDPLAEGFEGPDCGFPDDVGSDEIGDDWD